MPKVDLQKFEGASWQSLIPDAWKSQDENNDIWVRCYAMFNINLDKMNEFGEALADLKTLKGRVLVALTRLQGFEANILNVLPTTDSTGKITLQAAASNAKIGDALCFLVMTPMEGKEEIEIKRKIDHIVSWITIFFGANLAHSPVFEGTMDAITGDISFASNVVRSPAVIDGPYLRKEPLIPQNELSERWDGIEAAKVRKIERALELIHKSQRDIDPTDAFLAIWTGIEVLCGGTKIRSKIHRRYKTSGTKNIDKDLGLPGLTEIRQNLIHKGMKFQSRSEHHIRRYMQFLAADLIRFLAGLPDQFLAFNMRQVWELDLRALELPDYRSDKLQQAENYQDPGITFS